MSYRRDNRTVEQFKKDIRIGTRAEAKIIKRYVRYFDEKYGLHVQVEDNGCDNSGKYLKHKDVSTQADFRLNGRLVEVKFNNSMLDIFHFKQSQLESYLKQGAVVLWVNGWQTRRPKFTILKRRHLEKIKRKAKLVAYGGWGDKLCYRLHADDYHWYSF